MIGFDSFHPPHRMGSSHGKARVIRKSYSEGTHFVPMLERSYELFFDLQDLTGSELIKITHEKNNDSDDENEYLLL